MYIYIYIYIRIYIFIYVNIHIQRRCQVRTMGSYVKFEVDALGGLTISRGCFERCYSNKKTPPYHSSPTMLCVQDALSWRRCFRVWLRASLLTPVCSSL